jgi:hypothetical protein
MKTPRCPSGLWIRGEACQALLDRAHRLIALGDFGARLQGIVHTASDVLDDIDESLLSRHPVLHAADYAMAAQLHRRLEEVQAAIPPHWRTRPPTRPFPPGNPQSA